MRLTSCFDQIVEKYREPIFQYLYRLVRDQDVAVELALEVFVEAHRRGTADAPPERCRLILFRDATRRAFRCLRRSRPRPLTAPAPVRALEGLPEQDRAAFLLRRYEGLQDSQIAAVLDCRESAARAILLRAYRSLRAELAGAQATALPFLSTQPLSPLRVNSPSATQ
ncbi:MAG: RNA polymerase sigma factor [Bryobacteraceae bacterium]